GGDGPSRGSAGDLVVLPVAGVADWDPEGDGRENPDLAALAHDGDATTQWRTEGYRDTGDFSRRNDKTGVGLRITLTRAARARELVLTTPTAGAAFQVRPGEAAAPVASATTTGGRQVVRLADAEPQTSYTLWFTDIPADPADGTRYRVYVGEVDLRGAANGS
ncbi:MAG: hypothetical protein AB1416_14295, partial [Actinomycetota bacterium]